MKKQDILKASKDSTERRQKLFNHLSKEHDLVCLEEELDTIINICKPFPTDDKNMINKFIDYLIEQKIIKDDDLKYYLDDYLKELTN